MRIIPKIRSLLPQLWNSAPPDPALQPTGELGPLVTSNQTIGSLVSYIQGSGDDWLYDIFAPRFYGRNDVIHYVPLLRCVTLISGVAARMLCRGNYYIFDAEGCEDKSQKAQTLRMILADSLNGRVPANQTIEDIFCDYLLDGNALVAVTKMGGKIHKLHRAQPWTGQIKRTTGTDLYYLSDAEWADGKLWEFKAKDVIHPRWPYANNNNSQGTTRIGFARAPVQLMRPALEIGMRADHYIRTWLKKGIKTQTHIDYAVGENMPPPDPETQKEIIKYIDEALAANEAIVTHGAKSSQIKGSEPSKDLMDRREYQKIEIASFYGIPPPLIGVNVTQWGQGIGELGKLSMRFSIDQHIQRVCDAISWRTLPRGSKIHIDPLELYRGDPAAIKMYIDAVRGDAQRPGCATIAEMRRFAGLPKDCDMEQIPQTMRDRDAVEIIQDSEMEIQPPVLH